MKFFMNYPGMWILYLAEPDENFPEYYSQIQEWLKGLSTTVLVLAAEEISFGDVLLNQDYFQENWSKNYTQFLV